MSKTYKMVFLILPNALFFGYIAPANAGTVCNKQKRDIDEKELRINFEQNTGTT
jgi:hypothetical protein